MLDKKGKRTLTSGILGHGREINGQTDVKALEYEIRKEGKKKIRQEGKKKIREEGKNTGSRCEKSKVPKRYLAGREAYCHIRVAIQQSR